MSAYSQDTSSIHGIDVLNRLGSLVKNTGLFGFGVGVDVNSGSSGKWGSDNSNSGSMGYSGSGQYSSGFGGYSGNSGSGYSSSYSSQSSSGSKSSSSSSSYSESSSYSSSGSSYSSLPSISKLEKYIYDGDIVEIIQTIQLVVDSKVKCEAKVAYLNDFLGRICAAIEVKKYALNELKAIVAAAVTQVQKLTAQIQTIKTQQSSLRV